MHSELSIKKMFSKLNVFVIALFVGFSIQSSSAHTYKTGECPTVEPMGDFNMKKVCSLCRLLRIPQHFVYRIEIEHIPEPTTCLISLCRSSKGQFCLYIFGFPTSAHNMCVVYSNILRKRYNKYPIYDSLDWTINVFSFSCRSGFTSFPPHRLLCYLKQHRRSSEIDKQRSIRHN